MNSPKEVKVTRAHMKWGSVGELQNPRRCEGDNEVQKEGMNGGFSTCRGGKGDKEAQKLGANGESFFWMLFSGSTDGGHR